MQRHSRVVSVSAWTLAVLAALVCVSTGAAFTPAVLLTIVLLPLSVVTASHGAVAPSTIAVGFSLAAAFVAPLDWSKAPLVIIAWVALWAGLLVLAMRRARRHRSAVVEISNSP